MLTIKDATQNFNNTAKTKTNYKVLKMLILGFLAGVFIALAGVGCTFGNVYGNKIVGAAIFPIGLTMVVLCGTELFTGNCLLLGPCINKQTKVTMMLKNWVIVYLSNFAGAICVTILVVLSGALSPENVNSVVESTANSKVSADFVSLFIKGIFCNFLVCVAVWMAYMSKSPASKILCIFGPIFLFVICGFEHSIANMYFIPAEIFTNGNITWGAFLVQNLLPVTLGNIVGGCAFSAAVWAGDKLK